jgi:hypothetical protein
VDLTFKETIMARSKINETTIVANTDDGSVLFSLVRGEQIEFPLILNFASVAVDLYELEAVVLEADQFHTSVPIGAIETTLTIRRPTNRGVWAAATAYDREDYVEYPAASGTYYKLLVGAARVSATLPDADPLWEVYNHKTIYIQFPKELSVTPAWVTASNVTPALPLYGYFELRVTEPNNAIYIQTWKPIRGLVELHFSPTDII